MKKNRAGQAEPLTKQSFKRVYYALENLTYKTIFSIAWYTAERPGAILKLTVEDVYTAGVPREVIVFPSRIRKDRKTREVPVSKQLRPILQKYEVPLEGWLFPSPADPLKSLGMRAYQGYLSRKFKELGMEGYSTYSTRRGAITELARAGLGVRQIQAISGHADLASLQRYIEVDPDQVRRGMELL